MNLPIHIRFGSTGSLVYFDDPSVRPTSVTSVTVHEDADSETSSAESALGSGSVETNPNTTFDAASGASQPDPTKLNLTATTGIVEGRQYLTANAYGENEWVEVQRIDSANAVYARTPLLHDYAATDTFQSTRMVATVDTTWAADTNNLSHPLCPFPKYRIVWVYVAAGETKTGVSYFDLTRVPWHHSVTASDIDRLSRGWLDRLPADDRRGQGQAVIEEAAHQVKLDIWERGIADYALRNSAVLNELIRLKAIALSHDQNFNHGGANAAQLERADASYFARLTKFVDAGLVPVMSTEDGAAAPVDRSPVWRR